MANGGSSSVSYIHENGEGILKIRSWNRWIEKMALKIVNLK